MSRRIDIELTSALADNSWTWRAAGAKQPKGTLDGSILSPDAGVGDVIKVEVEQEIDGINVLSVVGGREKQERDDRIELIPSEREFKPLIETRAKRDRNERGGRSDRERRPRRDRDDKGGRGDRPRRDDRGDGAGRGDGRGDGGRRDDRGGRGRRSGPSFTPPPEIPQRPKPKRLKPGKRNRTAVLAELPEEQRPIAELALQGMGAVRQRLREENDKAAKEGRSPMPEASVLKLAEDLIPKLRVAEWRDRAEAAQRQMEHLDLRDLRSVVAAAGDPAVARDETTSAIAAELSTALAAKQEQELRLWFGDVDAALAVGRVIRALRLSSQPPKAGVPFPTDIAQRLLDSTNASLAPMDTPERWIAMLEAAAFSPVRSGIAPVRKPDVVNDELMATVKRLAPALPQVAALFEIEVDPKAPMPKPLRPGPRTKKGDQNKRSDRPRQGDTKGTPSRRSPKAPGQDAVSADATAAAATGSPSTEPAATDTATPASEPADVTVPPSSDTAAADTVPARPDASDRPDADDAPEVAAEADEPIAADEPSTSDTPEADSSAADDTAPEPADGAEATAPEPSNPTAEADEPIAADTPAPAVEPSTSDAPGADTSAADDTAPETADGAEATAPEPSITAAEADAPAEVAAEADEPIAADEPSPSDAPGADTSAADDEPIEG